MLKPAAIGTRVCPPDLSLAAPINTFRNKIPAAPVLRRFALTTTFGDATNRSVCRARLHREIVECLRDSSRSTSYVSLCTSVQNLFWDSGDAPRYECLNENTHRSTRRSRRAILTDR